MNSEKRIKGLLKKRNNGCECISCQDTTNSILKMVDRIKTNKAEKLNNIIKNLSEEIKGHRKPQAHLFFNG